MLVGKYARLLKLASSSTSDLKRTKLKILTKICHKIVMFEYMFKKNLLAVTDAVRESSQLVTRNIDNLQVEQ